MTRVSTQRLIRKIPSAICSIFLAAIWANAAGNPAWKYIPHYIHHTDHSTFFNKPFKDGPSVTRACLTCHPEASGQIMKTVHWNWEGDPVHVPGRDQPVRLGKKNAINNYCIGIQSNWPKCTQCHAGYGWTDESFDFSKEENIDCLVCHDGSNTYAKDSSNGGIPDASVDLQRVAGSVKLPGRSNCGYCHFAGGGGDAVKHGDMDGSLLNPSERVDIHMSKHSLECIACHRSINHNIPGRLMSVSVDNKNRIACSDCHKNPAHQDIRLESQAATIACQTCHIPFFAVDRQTKMSWDWSQAGDKELEKQINDPHEYTAMKGRFIYEQKAVPEYAWYNGMSDHYLAGEKIDPSKTTLLTEPLGDIRDPRSKIWPFKIHRGKQPYDSENMHFLIPKTYGKGGYWTDFDWNKALGAGSEASGLAYSGKYGFASTEMYWTLNHMVSIKSKALQCIDCHNPKGRLDWRALGYEIDPAAGGGRKKQGLLNESIRP